MAIRAYGPTFAGQVLRSRFARGSRAWLFVRDRIAMVSLSFLVLVVLMATLAPVLPNAKEGEGTPDPANAFHAPNPENVLGTDHLGRDQFARLLYGARTSLVLAVIVVVVGAAFGTALGAVAGFAGGWIDEAIMRFTDMMLSMPALLLAIVLAAVFRPSLTSAILAITLVWWPWYARLVRGQAVSIRERHYVVASRSIGASPIWILRHHIVPNILGPVRIQVTFDFGAAILTGAGLSFLGLGVQPPEADWGSMISSGRHYLLSGQWWLSIFPGLAIYLTVLSFNLIGDTMQRLSDPRNVRSRA